MASKKNKFLPFVRSTIDTLLVTGVGTGLIISIVGSFLLYESGKSPDFILNFALGGFAAAFLSLALLGGLLGLLVFVVTLPFSATKPTPAPGEGTPQSLAIQSLAQAKENLAPKPASENSIEPSQLCPRCGEISVQETKNQAITTPPSSPLSKRTFQRKRLRPKAEPYISEEAS